MFQSFLYRHHEVVFSHLLVDRYLLQTFVLNTPVESLPLTQQVPTYFQLHLSTGLPDVVLKCWNNAFTSSFTACSHFHFLYALFLHLNSLRGSVLRQVDLSLKFPVFLSNKIVFSELSLSSLYKMNPTFQGTYLPHGQFPGNSAQKFTNEFKVFKFSLLSLQLPFPGILWILKSTISWSLQPRLLSIATFAISFSLSVSSRSSTTLILLALPAFVLRNCY